VTRARYLLPGAAVLIVATAAQQSWSNEDASSLPVENARKVRVERTEPLPVPATTAAPLPQPVATSGDRPFDCLIEPSQVVKLSAPVEGVLAAVDADRGDFVQRGQVVARLRSEVEAAGVAVARARAGNTYSVGSAEARLAFLAAKRSRAEKVRRHLASATVEEAQAEESVAQMTAKEAELALRIARLELTQSERQLEQRVVRSPIAGVVTERVMSPGEFRNNEAAHILTVARLNPLHVEVFAPIAQIDDVRIGSRAKVFPEDPIGGEYTATVKIIDRVFDAASGTFGLRLELPNPGNRLPAGLRCRIEFAS
jgi:RND family efflux transporter MFP subunit